MFLLNLLSRFPDKSGIEYNITQFVHSSALNDPECFAISINGRPNSYGMLFQFFSIIFPICFQLLLEILKSSSNLSNVPVQCRNIAGVTFSKRLCIISTGKLSGNLIDCNSNKILRPFIPVAFIDCVRLTFEPEFSTVSIF